jgi:hypothetical protein
MGLDKPATGPGFFGWPIKAQAHRPLALEEPNILMKPPSRVMVMINPPCSLPFFDALSTGYFEFVHFRIVRWRGQTLRDI